MGSLRAEGMMQADTRLGKAALLAGLEVDLVDNINNRVNLLNRILDFEVGVRQDRLTPSLATLARKRANDIPPIVY